MNIGDKWNGWTVDSFIGEGSFGKVYKLTRTEFGYTYESALKVIRIPHSRDEVSAIRNTGMDEESVTGYFRGMVEEIVSELQLMSELKGNSNIVSYEDHAVVELEDEFGWEIYLRMEMLTPFWTYVKEHDFTEAEAVRLGVDICKALEICRKSSIIHRDIKPENVFVSRQGDFKLGDFGIARQMEKTSAEMSKKGTVSYMAPEVYKGQAYDASVDTYSLGIMLYRLLNHNRLPFLPRYPEKIQFQDTQTALGRRLSGEPIPRPDNASDALSRIVLRACAFDPADRYSSPTEMKRALEKVETAGAASYQPQPEPSVEVSDEEATVGMFAVRPEASDEEATVGMFGNKGRKVPPAPVPEPDKEPARVTVPAASTGDVSGEISAQAGSQAETNPVPDKKKGLSGKLIAVIAAVAIVAVIGIVAAMGGGSSGPGSGSGSSGSDSTTPDSSSGSSDATVATFYEGDPLFVSGMFMAKGSDIAEIYSSNVITKAVAQGVEKSGSNAGVYDIVGFNGVHLGFDDVDAAPTLMEIDSSEDSFGGAGIAYDVMVGLGLEGLFTLIPEARLHEGDVFEKFYFALYTCDTVYENNDAGMGGPDCTTAELDNGTRVTVPVDLSDIGELASGLHVDAWVTFYDSGFVGVAFRYY